MASFGTHVALIGAVGLTLPGLFSLYPQQFGLRQPPIPGQTLREAFCLRVRVGNPSHMLSPRHSILTHMFCHADAGHWFGNIFAILSSGYYLDLGFARTTILIVGGGIAGAFACIVEKVLKFGGTLSWQPLLTDFRRSMEPVLLRSHASDHSPSFWDDVVSDISTMTKWILAKPSNDGNAGQFKTVKRILPAPVVSLCGASAAGYAMWGAETIVLCVLINDAVTKWKHARRKGGSVVNARAERERARNLMAAACGRLIAGLTQVIALRSGDPFPAQHTLDIDPAMTVAHSAHLGGFAFGVVAMSMFVVFGKW
ncbi:hypothetical protein HDU85_001836 [Gaertneriomyces sp. JEL0708]|nr:hypothetical protein HDU85_001836 [Gaertneriomyces sp. JEL0708]